MKIKTTFTTKPQVIKQKFYISFMALAVLMMLALAITPHHHHEGIACLVTEFCEEDDSVNDRHTGHDAGGSAQHEESCIARAGFIPNADNRGKCRVSSCDDPDEPGHSHVFSILYLAADRLLYSAQGTSPQPWSGEFITGYRSVDPHGGNSLRAPPCTLC